MADFREDRGKGGIGVNGDRFTPWSVLDAGEAGGVGGVPGGDPGGVLAWLVEAPNTILSLTPLQRFSSSKNKACVR